MGTEKIILNGRLALISIQRWKSDNAIREQFKSASEYYDFLMETSTTENINIHTIPGDRDGIIK